MYVYIKVSDTKYVCPNSQKFLSKIRVLNDFVTKLPINFLWLFLVSCNCCKMIPNRTVKQIWHQNLYKIMAIRKGAYIFCFIIFECKEQQLSRLQFVIYNVKQSIANVRCELWYIYILHITNNKVVFAYVCILPNWVH